MLKSIITPLVNNIPGWHTPRKIVVFESDDWGSIRMPDRITYDLLLSRGIRVDNCPYNKFDTLASEQDLSALFEVLAGFKDPSGNHPIITANCVVANPDFVKIRESGFRSYHYELFTDTLNRYPNHTRSFYLWREGIERKLFHPEFHGREHLHVLRWMEALRLGLQETRLAFDHNMFGLSLHISTENRKSYLQAYDVHDDSGLDQIRMIISEGLLLFRSILGYPARTFIAPNYTWPIRIEKDLAAWGVKYIKGGIIQSAPVPDTHINKRVRHYTGQRNSEGQFHIERNCEFEPSLYPGRDSVNECLSQVARAFKWHKPAVITSHRVNYIGSIVESNRDRTLEQLRMLLMKLKQNWPDIVFMAAEELGDLIADKTKINDEK
jgi:hypothetical protein